MGGTVFSKQLMSGTTADEEILSQNVSCFPPVAQASKISSSVAGRWGGWKGEGLGLKGTPPCLIKSFCLAITDLMLMS